MFENSRLYQFAFQMFPIFLASFIVLYHTRLSNLTEGAVLRAYPYLSFELPNKRILIFLCSIISSPTIFFFLCKKLKGSEREGKGKRNWKGKFHFSYPSTCRIKLILFKFTRFFFVIFSDVPSPRDTSVPVCYLYDWALVCLSLMEHADRMSGISPMIVSDLGSSEKQAEPDATST